METREKIAWCCVVILASIVIWTSTGKPPAKPATVADLQQLWFLEQKVQLDVAAMSTDLNALDRRMTEAIEDLQKQNKELKSAVNFIPSAQRISDTVVYDLTNAPRRR